MNLRISYVKNNPKDNVYETYLTDENHKYMLTGSEIYYYSINRLGEFIPCELEVIMYEDGSMESRLVNVSLNGKKI